MATIVNIPVNGLSFILNGSIIDDFVDGDTVEINLPNEATSRLNGAKNSVTITDRVDANVGILTFKVIRYSDNDKRLNALRNRKPIEVFNGSLKEKFASINNANNEIENWTLENGTFTTPPVHKKSNVGDTDDVYTVTYVMEFRNARRIT